MNVVTIVIPMKNNSIRIRLSDRRLNKLRLYAVESDKTMTQIIEALIDSLPEPQKASVTDS
ncbi:hypothetical protein NUACC21_32350 [Scytonema sp. NUACC21]